MYTALTDGASTCRSFRPGVSKNTKEECNTRSEGWCQQTRSHTQTGSPNGGGITQQSIDWCKEGCAAAQFFIGWLICPLCLLKSEGGKWLQTSKLIGHQCSLTETGCQMKVAMCSCPTVRKLDNIDVEPAQNHLCSSVERVQKESKSQPCQNQ